MLLGRSGEFLGCASRGVWGHLGVLARGNWNLFSAGETENGFSQQLRAFSGRSWRATRAPLGISGGRSWPFNEVGVNGFGWDLGRFQRILGCGGDQAFSRFDCQNNQKN